MSIRIRSPRCIAVAIMSAVGAMAVAPGNAEAQGFDDDDGESALEFRIGTAVPGSDLDNYFDPGFSAGLGYGFPLSDRVNLAFQGDVGFLSDVAVDDEVGTGEVEQFFEGQMRLWHYGADLQFQLTDPDDSPVSVVLHGGAGATTIDPEETVTIVGPDDPVFQDAETRTRFTANGGVSLGISVSENVDLLADGKAYSIFVDEGDFEPDDGVDDEIGETWWSFPVQLMLRYRMP